MKEFYDIEPVLFFEHLKNNIVRQTNYINKMFKDNKLTQKEYDNLYSFMCEINDFMIKVEKYISELEINNFDLQQKENLLSKFMLWFFFFNQLRMGNDKFIPIMEKIDKKLCNICKEHNWQMPKYYYENLKTIYNVASKN